MKNILIGLFLLSNLMTITNAIPSEKPTPKEMKSSLITLKHMAFENYELFKAFSEMIEESDVEVNNYSDYINFSNIKTQEAGCSLIQSAKLINDLANNRKIHPSIATQDMKKSLTLDMDALIKMTRVELDKRGFFCP
ncbi:hypothetical protein [Acinetobacter indicus]|jgi:hypothetical protein|uniref:hypothetical protein n=1 Tax=Acinetobacter indicus TaxID=756892 RepID=UPI000CEC87EA|nr:hypothetical protein [Acinetobacter indicus]